LGKIPAVIRVFVPVIVPARLRLKGANEAEEYKTSPTSPFSSSSYNSLDHSLVREFLIH
jgi:hypothetical protein